ncbi:uncharacterized protein BDR25DRAFT_237574 [Lindgomyces ingoldianus]|uniref:Uncharacterized protein n=1 Tax=Lindgomyces ingoldianus TaxID=673940 RepID=A0ACB6QHA5_9PLEO|nr:uncharacterized protein BDR25DRAFT_237574 [Lindgomyces ingoldianus]KAF2466368.1 hypothetical protein BDR25DRAFT_237574 [Lindgomyces ingoldianus]
MPRKAARPIQRKGPAFKPPRPVKQSAHASNLTTTKLAPGPGAPRSAPPNRGIGPSRPGAEPTTTLISSDSESENGDALSASDGDEPMEDVTDNGGQRALPPATELSRDPIPPPLLVRILHEGFEDKDIKIKAGAMHLVGEYMNIFVREAIMRAHFERNEANKAGGISDDFLQVEDLEKLAPQLILDF